MCWRKGEKYNKISNNNNSSQEVVPYILPSCKRNLATIVKFIKFNDQYNSVQKIIIIMLEEPKPDTNKEIFGHLDSGATSNFIHKTFPGKIIQHKPMKVGWANT